MEHNIQIEIIEDHLLRHILGGLSEKQKQLIGGIRFTGIRTQIAHDLINDRKIQRSIRQQIERTSLMSIPPLEECLDQYNCLYKEKQVRELIDKCDDILEEGLGCEQVLVEIDRFKSEESCGLKLNTWTHINEVITPTIKEIEDVAKGKKKICLTGFGIFDAVIQPQEGNLLFIAARPGVGKTALVLNIISRLMDSSPVGLIELEMSGEKVVERLMGIKNGIKCSNLTTGKLSNDEWGNVLQFAEENHKKPLFINTKTGRNWLDVEKSIISLVELHKAKWVFLDNLSLIQSRSHRDRLQQLEHITASMKSLSMRLGIVFVVIVHLNRETEKRSKDKDLGVVMPLMSDLRSSGTIEQDADGVLALVDGGLREDNNVNTFLINLKNRYGKTGFKRIIFKKDTQQFLEKNNV